MGRLAGPLTATQLFREHSSQSRSNAHHPGACNHRRETPAPVTKNAIRALRSDQAIDKGGPAEGLPAYQEAVAALAIGRNELADGFGTVISNRQWQWLPGKEALGYLVGDFPMFWQHVRDLGEGRLRELLQRGLASSAVAKLKLG